MLKAAGMSRYAMNDAWLATERLADWVRSEWEFKVTAALIMLTPLAN